MLAVPESRACSACNFALLATDGSVSLRTVAVFFPCCSAAHPVVTVLDRACELDGGESGGDATAAPAVEMDSVTVAASVTRSRPGFMGLAFPVIVDSRLLSFRPKRNRS